MISGYEVGTSVKWNEDNTLVTGVVVKVFRESGVLEMDDKKVYVKVGDSSPSYLIRHSNDKYIVLPHEDVMLEHTNSHT